MNEFYYLNGRHVNINFPLRAAFYGDGVFETFRCRGDLPKHIQRHLARLRKGAELLSIPVPEEQDILGQINNAYTESAIEDAYMKICLLPEGGMTYYEKPHSSSVFIIVRKCEVSENPLSLCVSSYKRSQYSVLNTVKTLNYVENILVKREAIERGYDDAILLNNNGEITEASSYNVFWTRGKGVFTPSLQCGLLPGITRELMLEVLDELGYQINERRFGLSYMLNSDFVFLTNSVAGMKFVNRINDLKMPDMDQKFNDIKTSFYKKMCW